MTLGFAGGPREATCRFCARTVHPELLSSLGVPYFRQPAVEVCPACRTDYLTCGWQLRPFVPVALPDPHYLWPEPRAADLEGVEGELQAGVEAYLEARRRIQRLAREESPVQDYLAATARERPLQRLWLRDADLARLAFGLDPELEPLLRSAWEAFDDALPSYSYTTEVHARAAVLLARLTLELGDRAPRSYGPRKKGPAAWLTELRDQARTQPALRDPRLPLLRALLYREEDNLAAVDSELREAERWLEALPPEPWRDAAFATAYDLGLRAGDGSRGVEVRDHLKRCCALRPDEPILFLRLAQAYLTCAQPQVAREILSAKLGAARVTDAAVADLITGSLSELRPLLEAQRGTERSDDPLQLLYGACLLGLGDADAAWRALGGSDLLDDENEERQGGVEVDRLHLAALVAHARDQGEAATRLLTQALRAADGSRRPSIQHNLLCVVVQQARDLLEDLEERTRPLAARRAELLDALATASEEEAAELRSEGAEVERTLVNAIRGPLDEEEGGFAAPKAGLVQLHDLIQRHAGALLAVTGEHERTTFANFLGRELGAWFRPLVTPPSLEDRDDLRVSDARIRIDLTYLALAKRRLRNAVREDRAAREFTGHAAPIHLVLTYLELVRRGGQMVHAGATHHWARLPARRPPAEVGLLIVTPEALEQRDVSSLLELFEEPGRGPTVGRPSLRALRDRCQLVFPQEAPPHELARDPAVRAYVRTLVEACPAFPLLLDMSPDRGQFELFFGALASPDALEDEPPHLRPLDVSVVDPVRRALTAIRAFAASIDLSPDEATAPLLGRYPPDQQATLG